MKNMYETPVVKEVELQQEYNFLVTGTGDDLIDDGDE